MKTSRIIAVLVMSLVVMTGGLAVAHQSDESLHVTEVREESGEVEQLLSISAEDLAYHLGYAEHGEFPGPGKLAEAQEQMDAYLEAQTPVLADGEECDLVESEFIAYPGSDGRVHYHQLWQCPVGSREITLTNRVLVNTHGGYRHRGRVQVGEEIIPTVFDARFSEYSLYFEGDHEEAGDGEAEEKGSRASFIIVIGGIVLAFLLGAFLLKLRRGKA